MRTILIISILVFINPACNSPVNKSGTTKKIEFNKSLSDELAAMVVTDQIAAMGQDSIFDKMSEEAIMAFKDSVYRTHQRRLDEIYDVYGYPGYDLVGKKGSNNFWLMTQHCDFDPDFQNKILIALEKEVKKENADGRNFGLLRDRVNINTGKKQIYGTQVTYNRETGQAIPKSLADSSTVNVRRKSVGLETIEEYLNVMTIMHFDMNKENLVKRGILEPKLYPSEEWEQSEAAEYFRQQNKIKD